MEERGGNVNIIETRKLTKKFGDFVANNNINLQVKKGEIKAIVGENGAGKTTLMNMLFGLLEPTEGEILYNEKPVKFKSPKDAIGYGLGMVHQHFKMVSSFTIYENILLGAEITEGMFINKKKEIEAVEALIEQYGFDINPKQRIADVSIGVQQRVEILKMLYRNVDVLILDEPTAVLTPQEVEELLVSLKKLKDQGKTIIIITHKLSEVKRCSDSITVIRRGEIVGEFLTKDVNESDIAKAMVGRDVSLNIDKKPCNPGEVLLEVKNIKTHDERNITVLDNVSFSVRAGEVLGVAGVEGNGQSELVAVLTGLMKVTDGEISIKSKNVTNKWPDELRAHGLGMVPEDRYLHGLCKDMKISENLIAGYHMNKPYVNKGFLNMQFIDDIYNQLVKEFDIRVGSMDSEVSKLSGGNAQKVIIAREIYANPDVFLASQPTRGVDIGSIEFIHKEIIKMRDKGKAVLLVSSELTEIMNLSDRIIVMYGGKIVGEVKTSETSKEELGLMMVGLHDKGESRV